MPLTIGGRSVRIVVRARPYIPGRVAGSGPVSVERASGVWTVSLDYRNLVLTTAPASTDLLTVQNPVTGVYTYTTFGAFQPASDNVTAIDAATGTGFLARTDDDPETFAFRTLTAPAAGLSISNPAGIAGNPTFALANDLAGLEAVTGTGFAARTADDTWVSRTLAAPAAGFTITNPAGIAGNPTFALSDDLAGVEGLSGTGLAARTASNTWATRSLAQPAAGFTITNSDAVSGNPTFALSDDLAGLEGLSGTGFSVRTASNTWANRTITASGAVSITNGDGIAGNPAIALTSQSDGTILSNISGGSAAPTANGISAVLDKLFGTTRGSVIYRGASAWAALAPGTSTHVLTSNGAGADPSYQSVGAATIPDGSLTRAKLDTNGQQGLAKAWFNLNGTGTIAGRDSFNVASYTDNGVGNYQTNLSSGLPNADYATVLSALRGAAAEDAYIAVQYSAQVQFEFVQSGVGYADTTIISGVIMGDL